MPVMLYGMVTVLQVAITTQTTATEKMPGIKHLPIIPSSGEKRCVQVPFLFLLATIMVVFNKSISGVDITNHTSKLLRGYCLQLVNLSIVLVKLIVYLCPKEMRYLLHCMPW